MKPFENLCVITARGGSKRIPRKNIRPFCGKPIIVWSIEAALGSGLFEHVIVSTDDAEIAEVAQSHGAAVPFMRPASLSDDYIGTGPVLRHATQWVANHIGCPEYVCCLYPTAPFVTPEILSASCRMLRDGGATTLITAAQFPAPIQRALRVDQEGRIRMFQPEYFLSRSQDLEPAYHDAGQFFWAKVGPLIAASQQKEMHGFDPDAVMMVLPRYLVQDIDTEEDWQTAELMFQVLQSRPCS